MRTLSWLFVLGAALCTSQAVSAQAQDVYVPGAGAVGAPHNPNVPLQPDAINALVDQRALLVTHPGAGAGGADESRLQTTSLTMTTLGLTASTAGAFRLADDFTVPASGYVINSITVYAYQTGSTTTSTFNNLRFQIWNGDPSAPGSTVVFGDTTTNRFSSTAFSNIYRTTETTVGTTARPIMAITASGLNINLAAGTYWLDYQTGGTLASGPFSPPITILGQTTTGNALQFNGTIWAPANDGGTLTQQGIPMTIDGAVPASISLEATVGTTPGVCAATDTLTVTAGTQVHYCYTVTNTGAVALNFHDLSDTVDGTILDDFPFNLLPGASAFLVVPATPAATVTRTGTWTAATALAGYTADATIPVNFQDIAGTGTAFTLTDDSVSAALPIGFSFDFFGAANTSAFVSSNGFMTFTPGSGNGCCSGQALPNPAAPNNLIAGWWEDLNPSAGGTFHYQTLGAAPNRVFIAQMTDVPHFAAGNLVTLQYKLFEGSNNVEVHYLAAPSDGGTHSAGIENADGTLGVQFSFGTTALPTPEAVRYSLTAGATATATDSTTVTVLIPNIDVSPASLAASAPVNQTTSAPLTIANTGQGDLNWAITEEPVGQPQSTPAGRGSAIDAREVVSEADLKPATPSASAPAAGPIWRAPAAVLYDNGSLITNPGAGAGGADVSALQTALGLGTFGFGHQALNGNRVADDFVVGGAGWLINTVTFFSYQTGSTTTSTHTAVNVRIWDGVPGAPGSNVVFGDTTTNRLVSSTYTNINRALDTSLTDGARPIMANVVAINTFLPAGTYWFDWQTDGSLASGPWAPPVSIAGQTAKPGANGLQFTAAWADALDGTFVQDFPFIVEGLADCSNPSDVPWLSLSQTAGTNVGGTSTVVTATFDATGLAVGNYSARLCATSNDPDVGPGNGTGLVIVPVSFNVAASADLVMTLTDAPDPVTAGTNLTYTGTVTNNGPTAANNVSFSLPLPANTSFVSATPSAGGACAGNPVVCTWAGSTAVGASNTATITVLVAPSVLEGATLTATATATSPDFDPNLANNAATTTTSVIAVADLQVSLTSSVTTSPINVPVTFTATSLNLGPSDAQTVSVTITLTPDFRYSSHSAAGATCTTPQVGNTGAIVCTWAGATAPGASRTLSVVAFSNVQGPTAVNASTTSSTTDPVAGNNSTSVTVEVGYLVEEIPTLGNLGLLLMALMMGLMGFVAVRRQS
jgi:uncharacterized repeat protein (TIGR01451 family)